MDSANILVQSYLDHPPITRYSYIINWELRCMYSFYMFNVVWCTVTETWRWRHFQVTSSYVLRKSIIGHETGTTHLFLSAFLTKKKNSVSNLPIWLTKVTKKRHCIFLLHFYNWDLLIIFFPSLRCYVNCFVFLCLFFVCLFSFCFQRTTIWIERWTVVTHPSCILNGTPLLHMTYTNDTRVY